MAFSLGADGKLEGEVLGTSGGMRGWEAVCVRAACCSQGLKKLVGEGAPAIGLGSGGNYPVHKTCCLQEDFVCSALAGLASLCLVS